MKKLLLSILVLALQITVFAQGEVAKNIQYLNSEKVQFQLFKLFTQDKNLATEATAKAVKQATYAKIKPEIINEVYSQKAQFIEVEIPYFDQILTAQLYRVNPLHADFQLDTDVQKKVAYQPGVYYRGIIKGDEKSLVSFNFFENECNAVLSNQEFNNIVVAPIAEKGNTSDYIIYSDVQLNAFNTFSCATKIDDTPEVNTTSNRDALSQRCVTIYFEVDYNLYQANGNSVTATTNWLTSVFNNVQTFYNNDGLTISLKSSYIWTNADPYNGIGTTSADYLYKFMEVRPVFNGDLGQLLGVDWGGLGGVAIGTNGICTSDNHSYCDLDGISYSNVPTYSWTINVMAHELGHLFGSPHTHGCWWNGNNTAIDGCGQQAGYSEGSCPQATIPYTAKGTIMSYCHLISGVGINLANGFGTQPKNLITNKVNNGACLSTDCTNTCINTLSGISFQSSTANSVTYNWTDTVANTSWQVAVYPFGSSPTSWTTVNTNSYTKTGLSPNTYYVAAVRQQCIGGLEGVARNFIFVTQADYCNNITFYDTGGPTGQYEDNQTIYRIISPNVSGRKITLTFTQFSLEQDYDYIYVYNGNSLSAPSFNPDGYTGTDIPGPFTSTAVDGSLTLKFYSDGGVTDEGFTAQTSCTVMGTEDLQYLDFTYAPNPTTDNVTFSANKSIHEISIYNMSGQLLKQIAPQSGNTIVSLQSFADGLYIFKVTIDQKTFNLNIIKN